MKRKQSLIGGLDRILSVREASDLLISRRVAEVLCWPAWDIAEQSLETDLPIQSYLQLPHYRRTDLYPQGRHGRNGERTFMVVILPGEELRPDLVPGCPLSLLQDWRRQRLEKRIHHVGRMDSTSTGSWCIWIGYPGSSATDCKRSRPSPSRTERTACFT